MRNQLFSILGFKAEQLKKKIPLRTENKRISNNHSQCGCLFIHAACYLFVGTDGHIVCIILVMKEKSKIHGKPCFGVWVVL